MKKILLIAGICVVCIVGGYALLQQQQSTPSDNPSPTPAISSDPFISIPPDTSELRANGSNFRDPQGVYSFLYPNEYELFTDDPQHIRIIKRGATQQGQTELYDGVLVVFESIDLQGQTLENFVDSRIQQSTADGTTEVTEPKKATTLTTYPGFTYRLRGLGESTYVVVQKDFTSDSAVVINFLVADPEGQGYQEEVDSILSTFILH